MSKVGTATEKISKLKELDILGKKQKISDLLAQLNVSIVVIIDDIDRLTPKEAFEVLRLVKAVADFKGTAFLLAFDPKYLHSVLQSHAISNAEEYLDKIVQLRVPLPLIAEKDLQKITQGELGRLSQDDLTQAFDDQGQLSNIYHLYYRSLINSPRDVKRFFNHLRFVERQVRGQVAFSNLFGLSLLAMKAPNIYELLKQRPDYFVGRGFERSFTPESFSEKQKDKSKEVINAELEKISNPKISMLLSGCLKSCLIIREIALLMQRVWFQFIADFISHYTIKPRRGMSLIWRSRVSFVKALIEVNFCMKFLNERRCNAFLN